MVEYWDFPPGMHQSGKGTGQTEPAGQHPSQRLDFYLLFVIMYLIITAARRRGLFRY